MVKRICAVLLISCTLSMAQSSPSQQRTVIPTFELKLPAQPELTWPFPDHFPVIATQCGPHGNPYLWMFDTNGMEAVAFTPKGLTPFTREKMIDVPEPSPIRFFVSESGVYVLVSGIKNAREEVVTEVGANGKEIRRTHKVGEQRQYIARFSTDGSYNGALALDFPFQVMQIAAFESGDFLVAGVDANNVPRVAAVDSNGQLQNFVNLKETITADPKSAEAALYKAFGMNASSDVIAIFAQFIPYHGHILFVRGLGDGPIYEIRDGGEARAVNMKAPEGFVIDHLVPSDNNDWLLEFVNSAIQGKRVLYEVDPESGQLLRQYRLDRADLKLACRYQDDLILLKQSDGKLSIFRGTAEPRTPVTDAGPMQ